MAGSRGKKDKVYAALKDLMAEPGDPRSISSEIIRSDSGILPDEIEKLIEPYPKMDDRGVAIVFSSLVEINLERAIITHFHVEPLAATRVFSHPDGPLKNFSAKIAMGWALGIYDEKMNSDLKWILGIRNAFAHARVEVTFGTEAIVSACDKLKYPRKTILGKPVSATARERFTLSVNMIRNHLISNSDGPLRYINRPQYAAIYSSWPDPLPE